VKRRSEIVDAKVDLDDALYYVVMHDPEGSEFCVG
jgi:hypothetical protein